MLEAFKFSYAYQPYLGDPDFDSSVEKVSFLHHHHRHYRCRRRFCRRFCRRCRCHIIIIIIIFSKCGNFASVTNAFFAETRVFY